MFCQAIHVPNSQGNFPLHWAAQNSKKEALRFIIENYEVDVLAKNFFGWSTLTEAFQKQDTDIIELGLSHDSANEEKLLETTPKNATVVEAADSGASACAFIQ